MKDKQHTLRFLLMLSALLIVGFAATSWISYHVSQRTLREQIINNELPLTSDNIYSEIQRDLLPPVFIASLMANDSFLRNWIINGEKDPANVIQFLSETQRRYNTFTSFFVSEHTRRYYQSKGILKTVTDDNPQDAWYFRVRKMKADHEINVDPDQANQYSMTIFVNHKVFDFDGRYIGATGVGLKVSDVKKIIENYHRQFDRVIYFISPDGEIVLSSDNNDGGNIKDKPGISRLAKRIIDSPSASLEYRENHKTYYVNSRHIPELNWILVVAKSDENALRNIFRSFLLNLALCGIVTAIVISLIWLIVNSHRRKLREMLSVELELKMRNNEQKNEIDKQHRLLIEQNSRLIQINASKDKLFSIIAHDLRSPLGNMTQLATLSADSLASGQTEKAMEYLTEQRDLSSSALKLLDHLFDWAKSQMSEEDCAVADFPLRDCLTECLAAIEPQADRKNIAIAMRCAEDISVNADRNMIMTVVRNLVSNAIKFTNPGGRIEISASAVRDTITVSVSDSGIGISPERLSTLFDFVHNKSSMGTRGESGTGIGLSLCRELIRKNGGEITADSTEENGSVFRFTLRKSKQEPPL